MITREEVLVERKRWEFEIEMYTLLYLKQVTNKDLLFSTENSLQNSEII